jgi:hypothetical protein
MDIDEDDEEEKSYINLIKLKTINSILLLLILSKTPKFSLINRYIVINSSMGVFK